MSDKRKKNTDNENTILIPDSEELRKQGKAFNEQFKNAHAADNKAQFPNGSQPDGQRFKPNGVPVSGQPYPMNNQPYPQNAVPPNGQYYRQAQGQQQFYDSRLMQQSPNNAPGAAYDQEFAPPRQPKSKKPKKKKKSLLGKVLFRIFMVLFTLFVIVFGVYSCVALSIIGKMDHTETAPRSRTASAISKKYVRSVLIIGTDGRSESDRGRSDSMILVSFNSKSNKVIMTSFMRDCYVDIPGYGMNKLNAAYAFGGPELLMDTIEKNFNVKIDNYMSFTFSTFSSLIDGVGGIDIKVSDAEAQEINNLLSSEINRLMGDAPDSDLLKGGGKLHLNGKQALCYSRIRYVGNSDFERTSRQRKVLSEFMDKAAKSGPSFISKFTKDAAPYIATNMSKRSMYMLSLRLPFCLFYSKEQIQVPIEGSYSGEMIDGQSVLTVDLEKNRKELKDKIFSKK